jgi:pimeloyl-ACP methyl ester carboxylesterase
VQIPRYTKGMSLWSFGKLPEGTRIENVPLVAQDAGESEGALYTRGGEQTVVCFMHPRGDMRRHYAIPAMLEAGFACFAQAGRWLNNDVALIHEALVLDVAEAMRFLRGKGFARVVLFGNSGGGALYSLYQSQAATPAGERLKDTAAGDPFDLGRFEMPEADAIIQLATHLGQGALLEAAIDPSVTDEHDPLSCDPALDMYNPDNGFQPFPATSKYASEFLERYASAQRARVARIDAIARARIEANRFFMKRFGTENLSALPARERQFIERRAFVGSYLQVFRTEAHPGYADLSIDPSKRDIGSFHALRPDLFNFMAPGFGKLVTPQAWLSTWSGQSSRALTLRSSTRLTLPTLVVAYAGDNVVFKSATDRIFAASPASDKQQLTFPGDHMGLPTLRDPNDDGRAPALAAVAKWIAERFPKR